MMNKVTVFQPGSVPLCAVLIEKCAVLKNYVNIVLNQQKVTKYLQTKKSYCLITIFHFHMLVVSCIKGHCRTCNDGELEEKSSKAHAIDSTI